MMKTITNLIFYSVFVLPFFACSKNKEELSTINIEANINNLKIVNLSQFTDNIEYVPLETRDYILLNASCKCDFLDSLVLVYDLNQCQLYNTNGKFLNSIGSKGRGPGEFQFCVQACFSRHNSIYLQSNLYELNEYSLDGTLINKYNNTFRINNSDDNFIFNWELLYDSLFFGHMPNTTGQIEFKSLLINKQGDIKYKWKNYDYVPRQGVEFGLERNAYVYYFKGSLYFKQFYNDTMFYLDDKYELLPAYSFYLGNLKMPKSVRGGHFGGKELWDYISLYDVFQTENYLFLNCGFGNRFPAKRLTTQTIIQQMGTTWYNTTYMLGVVDKNSGNIKFCKPTSTDNSLFTTGIYNDIDAGPRFFPNQRVNDSTLVMLLSADNLKAHIASDDFKSNNPKFVDKKIKLENFADGINVMDNPVLMFVTFNK
jgi:hypothetical protein